MESIRDGENSGLSRPNIERPHSSELSKVGYEPRHPITTHAALARLVLRANAVLIEGHPSEGRAELIVLARSRQEVALQNNEFTICPSPPDRWRHGRSLLFTPIANDLGERPGEGELILVDSRCC